MLILISDPLGPTLPEKLAPFGEVTMDKARLPEADIVVVRSKTKCTPAYIDSAPNLKLIIRGGVGIDNIDVAYAQSKGIVVHNTPKAPAIAVAELTLALMLAVPNRIVSAHQSMQEGKWLKKSLKRTELYGKTLCLVGLGHIATEVARRADAFGMKVVAYHASGTPSPYAEVKPTLAEAVRDADYVSLHLPLTASTRGLIDGRVLAEMKPGAVLINTGRAGCVDAGAIKAALESGQLQAYATDVWPHDPPPPDYPILHAPNVLMTPHIGANSVENQARIGAEIVEIIKTFTQGERK